MTCVLSGVERSWSESSMRRMKAPPVLRAHSQLKSAVRTPPMWRYPVGDGAKRRRGLAPVTCGCVMGGRVAEGGRSLNGGLPLAVRDQTMSPTLIRPSGDARAAVLP